MLKMPEHHVSKRGGGDAKRRLFGARACSCLLFSSVTHIEYLLALPAVSRCNTWDTARLSTMANFGKGMLRSCTIRRDLIIRQIINISQLS